MKRFFLAFAICVFLASGTTFSFADDVCEKLSKESFTVIRNIIEINLQLREIHKELASVHEEIDEAIMAFSQQKLEVSTSRLNKLHSRFSITTKVLADMLNNLAVLQKKGEANFCTSAR